MPVYRQYEAISALAGAGKTYLLTTRFIGLVSQGVAPERILAITFTRKAAAEILDRVVRRLAAACANDADRADLLAALREFHGNPRYEFPPDAPLAWLRRIVDALPRLRIGTIDSFFLGIAQAFALELGLPLRVELMDDAALDEARAEAVGQALARAREDGAARSAFLEAFKRATAGKSKSVVDTLRMIVDRAHGLYLDLPEEDAWGSRERVWSATPWWLADPDLLADIGERLDHIEKGCVAGEDKEYAAAWVRIIDGVRRQAFGDVIDQTLFARLLAVRDDLRAGAASFEFGRRRQRHVLRGKDAESALALLAATVSAVMRDILHETQGRFRLTRLYEEAYREVVRGQGRFAFSDIPFLLRGACGNGRRLNIDYRLDSRFDHWMLDEFQDTSASQWEVLRNLADEVLQSPEPDRGFFYVGDVKQAIYGWRGGEASLFEHVRSTYAGRFGQPLVLDRSWRSSPVVLAAVNRVFSNLPALGFVPGEVCERWQRHWREHRAVPRHNSLPGRVELHVVDSRAGDEAEGGEEPPVVRQTALLVERLVAAKVASIAVLVRLNTFGNEIADALKRRNLDARREINPALLDNGTVSAVLSLLHLADHPSDLFAWLHVSRTPLGPVSRAMAGVATDCGDDEARRRVAGFVRQTVCESGVVGVVSAIMDRFPGEAAPGDAFISMRMRQLLDSALAFDRRQGGGPSAFAAHAASLMVSDPAAAGGITVMTVHKAKGLEFDAVILPDLQGRRRGFTDVTAGDLAVGGTGERPWVLPVPTQAVAPLDPVVEAIRVRAESRKVYDELCLLYVAMTRAKQGLYMVTTPAPPDKALYAATILQKTLCETEAPGGGTIAYADGSPDWPAGASQPRHAPPPSAEAPFMPECRGHGAPARRLVPRTPSGQEERSTPRMAETLFRPDSADGIRRGSALHDLFSRIGWIGEDSENDIVSAWLESQPDLGAHIRDDVLAAFRRSVADPAIRSALARPDPGAELWREQAFEVSVDGAWISGRFDRVVITRDRAGSVTSASVLDFKSDRVSAGEVPARAAYYRPQAASYRAALARLTGLPESAITARLLFTNPCVVAEV
jgi:ATP-dependent exoDNAse (exonuclease V) beta subunit